MKGRVTYSDGAPAAGAWLALVDEDNELDDLIGVGAVNDAGEFALTFTAEAFNQEQGEAEERPDLYAVVSLGTPAQRVPVLRRDFPGLAFDAEEDLGTIVLPLAKGASPTAAPGLRPTPGARKMVRRVRLDDELVRLAAAEVAGLVEELTGFENLLEGIRFEILDDFLPVQLRRLDREPTAIERARLAESAEGCDVAVAALWDAPSHTIVLNRPILEAQNYDALRVVLGHELAHVGQSRDHADIREEWERMRAASLKNQLAGIDDPTSDEVLAFMTNLEGHAAYVEEHLLRVFTHGALIDNLQMTSRYAQLALRRASTKPDLLDDKPRTWHAALEDSKYEKTRQYEAGAAAYRARGNARFDPKLRPALGYSEDIKRDLQKHADEGDLGSQKSLGAFLLTGMNGFAADPKRGVEYVERAAAQGDKKSLELLIAVYEEGKLVPRDIVKARIYKKRLAALS